LSSEKNLLEVKPLRNLKFWHIWALGVGSVVGDGIFLLLGEGIQTAGPASIVSFFIAGVLQLFLMLALVELAVGMPSAGAMGPWVKRFFGPWWGFLAGFSWAFAWIIVGGAISLALGRFLSYYIPINELVLAAIAVSIFAILNILGSLIAARAQMWMTFGLVGVMAGLVVFGFPEAIKGIPENFTPFLPEGLESMFLVIPMGAYAFMGTATLTTAGAECEDVRDLPRALVWASVTFIVLYIGAQFIALGTVPWQELSMAESPFVTAAARIFGGVGGGIINFAAILAASTCLLMGTFYSASRILFSESRKKRMPKFFGKLHPKLRTPIWGIVFIWAANIAFIIIAKFNTDFVYVTLTMQFTVAVFISMLLSIFSAIKYRKEFPEEVSNLSFNMPLPKLTFTIAIGGTLFTMYYAFKGSPLVIPLSLVWIIPLYIWFKTRPEEAKKADITA